MRLDQKGPLGTPAFIFPTLTIPHENSAPLEPSNSEEDIEVTPQTEPEGTPGAQIEVIETRSHLGSDDGEPSGGYGSLVALAPYLFDSGVLILDATPDRHAVLAAAAEAAAGVLGDVDGPTLLGALVARESQAATGTPEGIAFPHAMVPGLPASKVVVIRTCTPVEFGTGCRCDLVFAMFGDANQPWEHVRLLARLARITNRPESRERLRSAPDAASLLAALQNEDAANA